MRDTKRIVAEFLALADINVNGERCWDIQVHDDRFYNRFLANGSLGLGESYMEKWWDCDDLVGMVDKVLRAKLNQKGLGLKGLWWHAFKAKLFNNQTKRRAKVVGEIHYDVGNKLYEFMLDKRMIYTCGYWKQAENLEQAQYDKLDLICKKLKLKKGEKILDIGCGWGGFLKFAAEEYGISGVGITISKEQAKLAKENCAGLPIEIRLQDYRDLNEKFDHIASIGVFEHVGFKNYRGFMEITHKCLKDTGLALIHTIGNLETRTTHDPFMDKYIFPNSVAPSPKQLTEAMEGLYQIEDWHSFPGHPHYTKTILEWYKNFKENWKEIEEDYDETFYRMWEYYLLACAGAAQSQTCGLWQIVMSKNGIKGGYESVR